MRRFFVMALLAAPIGACVTNAPPPAGAGDACQASAMQDLVGQSESVLTAMTFAAPVRFIHPDTAFTEDFRPDRLNIHIDAMGTITKLDCG